MAKKTPAETTVASAVNNFVAKNMAKFTRHHIHQKSYKASRKLNKQNLKRESLDSGFYFLCLGNINSIRLIFQL